jgi:nanoRNase/pAp phosphatase (c-di-AMP/oligoRNAs hydrolase)
MLVPMDRWKPLVEVILAAKRLVVFLHDNPDPDCIASGWILKNISEHLGVHAVIVYAGRLGRAENRTMVKLLKIPLRHLGDQPVRHLKTDRYALLDTQPGTGNNSFPHQRLACHLVIDHHPRRRNWQADFEDIRPGSGCCTTNLLEYFDASGLRMAADLATACAYAILSETQDLERETTRADRTAYSKLVPLVRLRLLGKIRHPARKREYYRTVARAMRQVQVSKNTCVSHVGKLVSPEAVAEVADFFVAMEKISWCLVTGWHKGYMYLSIRTTAANGRAERIMRRILARNGKGGGHGMIAGGMVECEDLKTYRQETVNLTERFMRAIPRRNPEHLHSLLEEDDIFSMPDDFSPSTPNGSTLP